MNRDLISALITKHEAIRYTAYYDTEGKLTIGVGCNLDALGARNACEAAGIDYDAVRNGDSITPAQCTALLDLQLNHVIAAAQRIFSEFATFPDPVQSVICDLIFNLGEGKLLGFKRTIASLTERDWKGAAANLIDSAWYHQVKSRGQEDVKILEESA